MAAIPKERECIKCGTKFKPYRDHQLYCTKKCYMDYYNAAHDIPGRLKRRYQETKENLKEGERIYDKWNHRGKASGRR